ncbi:MAG: hypothetical protein AAF974_11235, partial [Cyanobacteria bacterium P01_E01_bin.34]
MKKVRIYSLRKDLGLDNCTPILDACKQVGIAVNSASSTITKAQARQVAELLNHTHSTSGNRTSNRSSKRKSKGTGSQPTVALSDAPANRPPVVKQKSRKQRSKASTNKAAKASETVIPPRIDKIAPGIETASINPLRGTSPTSSVAAETVSGMTGCSPSTQYLNGNRVFSITVTGLKGARMRHAFTT